MDDVQKIILDDLKEIKRDIKGINKRLGGFDKWKNKITGAVLVLCVIAGISKYI